jgi:hypothetical protein
MHVDVAVRGLPTVGKEAASDGWVCGEPQKSTTMLGELIIPCDKEGVFSAGKKTGGSYPNEVFEIGISMVELPEDVTDFDLCATASFREYDGTLTALACQDVTIER